MKPLTPRIGLLVLIGAILLAMDGKVVIDRPDGPLSLVPGALGIVLLGAAYIIRKTDA